jgi:hypothetical protein
MSIVAVIANQLILDINGATYECQIEETHITYPDDTGGTKRWTGCPDGEVTIPDPESVGLVANLQLVGLHDWSDAGISWVLTQAFNTVVPFTLNLDVDKATDDPGPPAIPAQARTYTGTLRIPRVPDDWISRQPLDMDLTFDVVTMTGPTRYTAP